jgi:hypothetical protein
MSGPATEFADQAPGVRSASLFREQELLHYYEGELEAEESTVRLITLAPTVTEDAIHETFRRVTGKWLNPSSHPNVVTVHERGREPRPWIAVEWVDGRSLTDVQFPLPPSQVRTIVVDVAEALRTGAQYNSTHSALTPEHIWLSEGQAVVDEWGLERACQVAAGESPVSPFTAPELRENPETDTELADVYALGAITYYALTGEAPTVESEEAIPPPSSLNSHSDVTTEVDEVVLTALEPDPANRYDSAYAFQTALKQALPTADDVAASDPERDRDKETSNTATASEAADSGTGTAEDDDAATDESKWPSFNHLIIAVGLILFVIAVGAGFSISLMLFFALGPHAAMLLFIAGVSNLTQTETRKGDLAAVLFSGTFLMGIQAVAVITQPYFIYSILFLTTFLISVVLLFFSGIVEIIRRYKAAKDKPLSTEKSDTYSIILFSGFLFIPGLILILASEAAVVAICAIQILLLWIVFGLYPLV